uniref:Nacetylglucosamine1phosphotransferase subunits alpha/beta putative n=1 Tax=Albugo laibachii Nc14 TaxID=890382 RepID=F0WT88_9STRA|nr:Nacetylglucosamine1phosphotransferase subunits alpha/beta putative [Albugo laibachii Nc14]|eukprot:CCA24576.1 Nacetylglucosamine1phosphotransferase subunits alpha/beta putative [Albugo laibachii Nc14]
MPYLIKKSTMLEMKSHWPQEFEATSSHRFRHPHDMQFGFSYSHYVINRHKLHPPTIEEIWTEYFDVNRNGVLDHLEMLTVASMADGVTTSETSIQKIKDCLQPPNAVKTIEKDTRDGKLEVSETLHPFITLDSLKKCKNVTEKLIDNVRRKKTYELMSEAEITFHMLSDNPAYALGQMLNTRARRTKFLCINDDMKNPSLKLHQLLHELFLAFWPNRSQFELPRHLQNRYLHIDEYYLAQQQVQKIYLGLLLVVVVLVSSIYWRDSIRIVGRQKVTRARTSSPSVLKRERIKADKSVIHKSSTSASSPRASRKSDADFVAKKME